MPDEIEDIQPSVPIVPNQEINLPDLSDYINKAENRSWDRANIDGAQKAQIQWGHAGLPPEQPMDITPDKDD